MIKYLSKIKTLVLIKAYLIISLIGIFAFSTAIGHYANDIILTKTTALYFLDWASNRDPYKFKALAEYIISLLLIFIVILSTHIRLKKGLVNRNLIRKVNLIRLCSYSLFINLFAFAYYIGLSKSSPLVFMILLPLLIYINMVDYFDKKSELGYKTHIINALLAVILISILSLTSFSQHYISNDFFSISGKTILKNGSSVDTVEYINQKRIFGLMIQDPRISRNNEVQAANQKKSNSDILIRRYTADELDFISKNRYELHSKAQAGWFFHHHNYLFGPINALSLGASSSSQLMIYGWLLTVFTKDYVEFLGGVNYQNYFFALNSYYWLYYFISILTIYGIYKNNDFISWSLSTIIISLSLIGNSVLNLAPGLNPARHFFDVIIFYLLYKYFKNPTRLKLVLPLFLSLLSILWSKEFGFFLFLSMVSAFAYRLFLGKIKALYLIGLFTYSAVGVALYLYPFSGSNPSFIYSLLGISTPKTPSYLPYLVSTFFFLLLYLTLTSRSSNSHKSSAIFITSYCALISIYFLWYPQPHHILSLCVPFIFLALSFYKEYTPNFIFSTKLRNPKYITLPLLLFTIFSVNIFSSKFSYFMNNFKDHHVYEWKFNRVNINTTMDPILFNSSAELINKYSIDKKIYIISKYDNILPIIANKYSGMPYNELTTNLVTYSEIDSLASFIKSNKPKYIFVDSDISDPLDGEIISSSDRLASSFTSDYLHASSLVRTSLIYNLSKVFDSVSTDYHAVEKSGLITVYEINR